MSDIDEPAAWGAVASPPAGDIIKDTLRKEQLLKQVIHQRLTPSLTPFRLTEKLRPLSRTFAVGSTILARVQTVQKEVDKLTSGNETLQMYIDNLTVQMAKRR
ncbi:hypothetical protein DFH06DRAFT_1333121 [Mycena polygramma]|nr:hypothetical protein DFH06DRAFT_1333121 [Mycena polygramma]